VILYDFLTTRRRLRQVGIDVMVRCSVEGDGRNRREGRDGNGVVRRRMMGVGKGRKNSRRDVMVDVEVHVIERNGK
jgi:hypothetical protein